MQTAMQTIIESQKADKRDMQNTDGIAEEFLQNSIRTAGSTL
jgi:hypothetical protein